MGRRPLFLRDVQCPFIAPQVGITSTPVIDIATGTIYILARSKKKNLLSYEYHQRLHALAITTGAEKLGGPAEIQASAPRRRGYISFNSLSENPRAALLLVNGSVYLTWGSSCDVGPYHGWVMAYSARTLRQQAVLNTSPNSAESGIWMSDMGPAADQEGNVYVVTGNGQFDGNSEGGRDYGNNVLKLRLRGSKLTVEDYFTPAEQDQLNSTDSDLGSGGPLLFQTRSPGKRGRIVIGGKEVFYLADPAQLGGLQTETKSTSTKRITLSTGIYSAPAYWNDHLYYYAEDDFLKDFIVTEGNLTSLPAFRREKTSKFSGATPAISANGVNNGLVDH